MTHGAHEWPSQAVMLCTRIEMESCDNLFTEGLLFTGGLGAVQLACGRLDTGETERLQCTG